MTDTPPATGGRTNEPDDTALPATARPDPEDSHTVPDPAHAPDTPKPPDDGYEPV